MLRKISIAIISTLVFGVLMGFMNYMTMPGGSFQDFWVPMFYFAMYAAPVYLIGGIAFSYFIDRLMKKINFKSEIGRHYTRYGLYILMGVVAAFIYNTILTIAEDSVDFSQNLLTYIIGGILASLIFYYVSLVLDKKEAK